jgi:hypothetical protein
MHPDHEPYVVHGIRTDPTHEVRIGVLGYGGRRFVDIRLHIRNRYGEWVPTRKGCTVPVDRMVELDLAVRKLLHVLEVEPPRVPCVVTSPRGAVSAVRRRRRARAASPTRAV